MAASGCHCYDKAQIVKIADAITQLKICQIAVTEKDLLIQDRLVANQATTPIVDSWYQDPRWVVGGIVVSFALGSAVGIWALRK